MSQMPRVEEAKGNTQKYVTDTAFHINAQDGSL